jgi:hypothetical protein
VSIQHPAPQDDKTPDDPNIAPDGHSWDYVTANAKDWYWHKLTGMCGGCGRNDCHPDQCPSNPEGYCTACPTRRETGEVRG